jgi:RHS repeat-associated protein
MSYDSDNRVTAVTEPFGVSMTFAYDSAGNRTLVQDSLGATTTSVYNADDLLTSRRFSDGTNSMRIDLTYTNTNQLSTLTRYKDLTTTNVVATTTYLYDTADRVTSIASADATGTSLASFSYAYDAGGRVTSEVINGVSKTYSYDVGNQLTSDGSQTFTFDHTGNRTNTGYTTTTGNELTSDGTWNYSYDHAGNVTQKTNISDGSYWKYSYDLRNELTEADQYNSSNVLQQSVTFKYDAFGNRVEKDVTVGSTTTTQRYVVDGWDPSKAGAPGTGAFDVFADLNGSNALTTRYINGDALDQLFARIDNGTPYWELTDRENSIRAIVNNSGVVKDRITYDGWGNATQTASAYGGRFLYTDQAIDPETGLEYDHERYLNLAISRFMSQDPSGFGAGDMNLYRYVSNNPTNFQDPPGLGSLPLLDNVFSSLANSAEAASAYAASLAPRITGVSPNSGPVGTSVTITAKNVQRGCSIAAALEILNGVRCAADGLGPVDCSQAAAEKPGEGGRVGKTKHETQARSEHVPKLIGAGLVVNRIVAETLPVAPDCV